MTLLTYKVSWLPTLQSALGPRLREVEGGDLAEAVRPTCTP